MPPVSGVLPPGVVNLYPKPNGRKSSYIWTPETPHISPANLVQVQALQTGSVANTAGSTDLSKILRYEDYSSMSLGQSLQSLPPKNGHFDAAAGARYSDEATYNGKRVVKTTITQGDPGEGFNSFGFGFVLPQPLTRGDRMFARVPLFFPSDFIISSSSNGAIKTWRYRMFTPASANRGSNDLQIQNEPSLDWRFIYEWDAALDWKNNVTAGAGKVVKGVWQMWETEICFDTMPVSAGGNAMMRLRRDGAIVAEIFDRRTMDAATDRCLELYLFTYWNALIPKTQSMYIGPFAAAVQASWRDDTPWMVRDQANHPMIGM